MRKILPFSEKTFLNSYSFLSYFLGILEGNGYNVNPFCYNNFISIIYARVTMHSLRHTNITMQIMAGVPIIAVAARAGHARTSTTTDVYAKFTKKANEQAAITLSNMFTRKSAE